MLERAFIGSASALLVLAACSSGGGDGNVGGAAGTGAHAGQGGSAGIGSGGDAGAGVGGAATGGSSGATGGSAGIGGTASGGSAGQGGGAAGGGGSGGAGGTPNTPGCPIWSGDCGGATGCQTNLASEGHCGACGVSCPAFQSCIGAVCAEAINPYAYDASSTHLGRNGLLLVFTESSGVRAVAKIDADSGVATKLGTLEGDAYSYCSSPKAAEGPDGAVYLACTKNRIFKLAATGGKAFEILQASEPESNNQENIAVLGSKLFYVGADGIYRANDDGSDNELWTKNFCVSGLAVDEGLNEIVFFCRYDHKIRVRGASKPPELGYVYDRELSAQAESGFWIDATHYWYRRLDSLVGSFYQGEILRIPKQGGSEEPMLNIFAPPATQVHVGKGGAYALQLIDEANHHFRVLKLGSGGAHEILQDWVRGYGKSGASMFFVGQSHLIFDPYGKLARLPL